MEVGVRRTRPALARAAGYLLLTLLALWGARRYLPAGLPAGIVLQGLIVGGLSALVAFGLVLLYRAARIVNFAQVAIGSLGATFAVALATSHQWPYVFCVLAGLGLSLLAGFLTDAFLDWRFRGASRLVLITVTIGILQVIGAVQELLPGAVGSTAGASVFTTPFSTTFSVNPLTFDGNDVVAIAAVPVLAFALWWFLARTDIGLVIQGASESHERALLLALPVRQSTRVVWLIAAALSGLAAILTAAIIPTVPGAASSPVDLLAPLAAALLARFRSLPAAAAWSITIGVVQQAVFWTYHSSTYANLVIFVLIAGGLALQRRPPGRDDANTDFGDWLAVPQARRIPRRLASLPEVRVARAAGTTALLAAAIALPLILNTSQTGPMAQGLIYAIIAVSLVVLTGWSGQISLGQFAFAGLGAAAAGGLLVHAHADLFVALAAAAGVGAASAALVSLPTLRLSGIQLAVVTMAFAVPVSEWLLSPEHFPLLNPSEVDRPVLFGRLSLTSHTTFYELCLAFLVLSLLLARNFRRSRIGRAVLAVNNNPLAAAGFAIESWRAKLFAAAFSGALAGAAGGLYVVAVGGTGSAGIDPTLSVTVFSMTVVGGLGSLSGALLGTAYFWGVLTFLPISWGLLASGGGLLLLLSFLPEGISSLLFRLRDLLLLGVARRRGLDEPTPSAAGSAATHHVPGSVQKGVTDGGARPDTVHDGPRPPVLTVSGIDVAFGSRPVLRQVSLTVDKGESLALLGTNGAGKSTLLRAIAGVVETRRGTILFDGTDISGWTPAARIEAGLVTVLGGRGTFRSLTVAENVRLAGWVMRHHHRDPAGLRAAEREMYEIFPALAARMHLPVGDLSGGERQMLNLGMALLCRPKLILLDELSLGLAPKAVASLLTALRQLLARGIPILVVEQSISVAAEIADRAIFLERGTIRYRGPTAALLDRPDLARSVFLERTDAATAASAGSPPPVSPGFGSFTPVLSPPPMGVQRAQPLALSFVEISKRFGGVSALTEATLDLESGEILGIIGANGAGKTTLLDVGSGFETPEKGCVWLNGCNVTSWSPARRAAAGLGRIFQDTWLFSSLTVSEVVAVARDRHIRVRDPLLNVLWTYDVAQSERAVAEEVEILLHDLGLTEWADTFVSELSTGTRRMTALACAVAFEPRVLVLDEPSSGLAQRECEELVPVLRDLRDRLDASFIVIDHDLALIEALSDRLAFMHLGHMLVEGDPTEILAHPEVIAAYIGNAEPISAAQTPASSTNSTAPTKTRAAPTGLPMSHNYRKERKR
jgi:ABC-type branched-subunit amino acid transport system ATPase component/ABC-type branched-subunit amino acid transport system permease subunit